MSRDASTLLLLLFPRTGITTRTSVQETVKSAVLTILGVYILAMSCHQSVHVMVGGREVSVLCMPEGYLVGIWWVSLSAHRVPGGLF